MAEKIANSSCCCFNCTGDRHLEDNLEDPSLVILDSSSWVCGQQIGSFTLLRKVRRKQVGRVSWECLCICGNRKIMARSYLTSGYKSCGCLIRAREPFSDEWRRNHAEAMNRPEVRKRLSEINRGRKLTEEHKRKISESGKGKKRRPLSDDALKRMAETLRGRKLSKEHRTAIAAGHRGLKQTQETIEKRKRSCAGMYKAMWQNPEFVKKQMRSRGVRPNKLENEFASLCKQYDWPLKYVGDGELVIGGKCPDFYDGSTKLVELFGDYWHRGQNPEDRINQFASYGYRCLVIWESEINHRLSEVIKRVAGFLAE